MTISIIGTGIYSLSLAFQIVKNGHKVKMWSENEELVTNFNKNHTLPTIIKEQIPEDIIISNNLGEVLENSDLIIIGTSAKYVRNICNNMKKNYNQTTPVCIASKGIENNTCSFLSDIVKEVLHAKYIAVISGPTFAIDLIHYEPAALSVASNSRKAIKTINMALASKRLKLRDNNDIIGTEICGSIKNVIAIAAGILEGLGYSESTRAFLITEALHDIKELLKNLECNPKTILSFAGIGDLLLTCFSPKSRNYQFGVLIGKKESKETIDNYLETKTTEGYYTLLSIKELTKNRHIKMPIINLIYDIVINYKNPELLSEFLINKE